MKNKEELRNLLKNKKKIIAYSILGITIFLLLFGFFIKNMNTKKVIDENSIYKCNYIKNGYIKNVSLNYVDGKLKEMKYSKGFNLNILKDKDSRLTNQLKANENKLLHYDGIITEIKIENPNILTLNVTYTPTKNQTIKEQTKIMNDILLMKMANSDFETVKSELDKYNFKCANKNSKY